MKRVKVDIDAEVKKLIEEENYDELIKKAFSEQVIKKGDPLIRIINVFLKKGQNEYLEKLLELKDNEKIKDERIQRKFMKILVKLGRQEEALEISNKPEFINKAEVQKAKIEILDNLKEETTEILRISRNPEFLNDVYIQEVAIKALIKMGKEKEALEIVERECFKNNINIQVKALRLFENLKDKAIEAGNDEEALKWQEEIIKRAKNPKFKDNARIQSPAIKALKETYRYREALEIFQRPAFKDKEYVQSQGIQILERLGERREIIKISQNPVFENSSYIQYIAAKMLLTLGELEEALKITEREAFKDNENIQKIRTRILIKQQKMVGDFKENGKIKNEAFDGQTSEELSDKEEKITEIEEQGNIEKYLDGIRTRIYFGKIDAELIEEINNNEKLSEYQRTLILLAICEKQNLTKNASLIYKKANITNEGERKNINEIIERMKRKTKIFNLEGYDKLLKWKFDMVLYEKYNTQHTKRLEQSEQIEREEVIEEPKKKQEESEEKKEKKVSETYEVESEIIPELKEKKKKNNNKNIEKEQKSKINDTEKATEILNFLFGKQKEVYLKVQSSNSEIRKIGIGQWDKLENMIHKIENGEATDEYIENLHKKVKLLKEKEEMLGSR